MDEETLLMNFRQLIRYALRGYPKTCSLTMSKLKKALIDIVNEEVSILKEEKNKEPHEIANARREEK